MTESANTPAVSVVMVVRNVERFLKAAIESILRQTFADFEFIIVDFGSTDGTKALVAECAANDGRIRWSEVPTCGLAEARNAAAALARARYLAVMDADDVALKDRLLHQVAYLESHPEAGVVGSAIEWVDAAGKVLTGWSYPTTNAEIQAALPHTCALSHATVLMRTEAFRAVGGYRERFAPAEDYELWLRMAESFELHNLPHVLLHYRIHPQQVSLRKRRQQSLGILGGQAAAVARRKGNPDPTEGVMQITSEVLEDLGVSQAVQETVLVREYLGWIRNMALAGESQAALTAANEALHAQDWKYAERWSLADVWLESSRLHWRRGELWQSARTAWHAVAMRPVVMGRPFKPMLQKLRAAAAGGN